MFGMQFPHLLKHWAMRLGGLRSGGLKRGVIEGMFKACAFVYGHQDM